MCSRSVKAGAVLAFITLAGCRVEPTPRVDADDPANVARAEIELRLRNYQESLVAGDARGAAALFTPGARLYLPDSPAIVGRGQIDQALTEQFATHRIVDIVMEFDATDVASGVASQFGTVRQRVRDPDGAEHEIDGRFAIRWIRAADAAWRIDRLLVNYAVPDSAVQDPDSDSTSASS